MKPDIKLTSYRKNTVFEAYTNHQSNSLSQVIGNQKHMIGLKLAIHLILLSLCTITVGNMMRFGY